MLKLETVYDTCEEFYNQIKVYKELILDENAWRQNISGVQYAMLKHTGMK